MVIINNIIIKPLDDLSSESDNSIDWGFYLYSTIVDIIKDSNFTMYYSDGFEIITTWFPGFILRNYVSLVLLARGKVVWGVTSAELLLEYDEDVHTLERLENTVPKSVYNRRGNVKGIL